MKQIVKNGLLLLTFLLTFQFLSLAQQKVFENNLQLAKKFYEQGAIESLLQKEQLNDDEKLALMLAEYYKFSQQDIPIEEMQQVINKISDKSLSDPSLIESEFAKHIKNIEDLMNTEDLNRLSNLKF